VIFASVDGHAFAVSSPAPADSARASAVRESTAVQPGASRRRCRRMAVVSVVVVLPYLYSSSVVSPLLPLILGSDAHNKVQKLFWFCSVSSKLNKPNAYGPLTAAI
jgi:hypothetical protein